MIRKHLRRAHGLLRRGGERLNQAYYRQRAHEGEDIMTEDWDILILLDAARADALAEAHSIGDHVEYKTSPGSQSWDFMQSAFIGDQFHDTVYVTANPYAPQLPDGLFHDVHSLLDDGWDDGLNTVRPEVVAEAARVAATEYPHKRLLIHFMQPHTPFIGEIGQNINHDEDFRTVSQGANANTNADVDAPPIWHQLRAGTADCDISVVRDAYRENLQLVLEHAEPLAEDLTGKTVLSADHGEMLGKREWPIPVRGFGHAQSLYVDALTTIPWVVIEPTERRDVRVDPPVEQTRLDAAQAEERLEAMGYI